MRMSLSQPPSKRIAVLLWPALIVAIALPIAVAARSPLLQWRDPLYVMAGFAGVLGMGLLLVQPLLAAGYLRGLRGPKGRRMHRWVGYGLLAAVVIHVIGLWITSPPDVIDALLFRSPTPFSVWGVVAMWALFAAALIALFGRRLGLKFKAWRATHSALVTVVVTGSVIHAMQIEGTMGVVSKSVLCTLVLAVMAWVIVALRSWKQLYR